MQRMLILAILVSFSAGALAEDAKQFFDSLYANRLKQVKATVDRADDLTLARDMLATARSIERTDLVALICDSVIDLSQRHADGLATAIDGARLLAEKVEPRRADARKKLVELLTRQSTTGDAKAKEKAGDDLIELLTLQGDEAFQAGKYDDALASYRQALSAAQRQKTPSIEEIKGRIELAGSRSRVEKQITRLREKLLADATDVTTVHEIIRLCVVELDNPAEATKVLDRAKDAKLIRLVPLAAKGAENASEADCLALGEWYSELSGTAPAASKDAMMRRAAAYLTRYLAFQPTDPLGRVKADALLKLHTATLTAAEAERAKIELKRNGPETWISREATYKPSSRYGHRPHLPDLLTGGKNLHDGEWAFHTAENTLGNYITIDLGSPMIISRLWIENRRINCFERAQGMRVFLSASADEPGRAVWTAENVANDWTVQLPYNMKARYITIKQAERNDKALHLAQVKVFGWEK